MIRTILLATDGARGARGAVRAAQLISWRTGARVVVAAIVEQIDLHAVAPPEAIALVPEHYIPAATEAVRERVRRQLLELGGDVCGWPIAVGVGRVSTAIARAAVREDADLIVLGLRGVEGIERWIARETLLRLVHLAHVPVLAVPPELLELPRKAVVAVDFSNFSQAAAQDALDVVSLYAELDLVHVAWAPQPAEGALPEWEQTYRAGVEHRLAELAATLEERTERNVTARTHLLTGSTGRELLRFADDARADLIVAGSHGSGFFGRILLGSVSSRLVHGASCALLIAPPRTVPEELPLEISENELIANLGNAGEWALPDSSGESASVGR
jgi:nucleotide-binding universal stress UspA family protein